MKPGTLSLPLRFLILAVLLSLYVAHPVLGWTALSGVVVFAFTMSLSRRALSIARVEN